MSKNSNYFPDMDKHLALSWFVLFCYLEEIVHCLK